MSELQKIGDELGNLLTKIESTRIRSNAVSAAKRQPAQIKAEPAKYTATGLRNAQSALQNRRN